MNQPLDYQSTYQTVWETDPPTSVTWESSSADILTAGRGFMQAFDFTLQTQVGCPGGCLFCYVPAGPRLTPADVRQQWGFVVRTKEKVIAKWARHLQSGKLADKTIYWSGVTDPYAAAPAITQAIWATLLATPQALRPRRIALQTRFRPDRDWEWMQRYVATTTSSDGGPPVVISYSIGTDQDALIAAWERATPHFAQRLHAIQTLCQAGLFVVATLSPLGLWQDLPGALTQFKTWGVAYLTTLFFKAKTASANTPRPFLAYLQEHYPLLLDAAWQNTQVQQMQMVYGPARVLVGQAGFASLACPHKIGATQG